MRKDLLLEIEILDDKISKLQKEKQSVFLKISDYKKKLERKHAYLIGRKAICININSPKALECVCSGVKCLDDLETIIPLFSRNGKKIIIETYEWVN
jgi:hypothetical protein